MPSYPKPEVQAARSPVLVVFQIGALTLVAALLALLIWRVATEERGRHLVSDIKAGKDPPAPAFNLPVLWAHRETWPPSLGSAFADDRLSPSELRGRPLVLNFFASWCIPCRHEAALLNASARAHAGNVVFLGVDVQDLKSDARAFLRRYRVSYTAVRDGNGSTYLDYGLTGVPETYWIDARDRIVAHYAGEISRLQLEQGIRASRRSK
jgi:cytochrome c biogenesis protein CcmG/thiol:disulfide interchange protein DsbE